MRKNRSIRFRGKVRKKKVIDLDITSLLDILVIILVFLLKSYSSQGIILNVPKDLELPISSSSKINTPGVIVQVSKNKIWVDEKEVVSQISSKSILDQKKKRIVPLYNELVKKKEMVDLINKSAPNAKKFSGIVNLIVDKEIKYDFIKKVLNTTALSGFKQYKFVVLGED